MDNKKMILTVGVPGCGKSTWAEGIRAEAPDQFVIVERDALRTEVAGKKYHDRAPNGKVEKQVTHLAESRMREVLTSGKSLIVSDTNLNPKTVRSLVSLAKLHGVSRDTFHIEHFDVDPDECRRRNRARDRVVPEHVMDDMIAKAYDDNGHLKEMLVGWSNNAVCFVPRDTPAQRKVAEFNREAELRNPIRSRAVVLIDVDGTLAKNSTDAERYFHNPLQNGKKKDFPSFYKGISKTLANSEVVEGANRLREQGDVTLMVLTGRDDSYLRELLGFLSRSELDFSRVICKRAGDFRQDGDFKADILDQLNDEGFVVVHAFDDRETSIRTMENAGILVSRVSTPEHVWRNGEVFAKSEPVLTKSYGPGFCLKCGRAVKDDGLFCDECATGLAHSS